MSATICQHLVGLSSASFPSPATPGACEDCLREGTTWVALRLCRECGHVGCYDSSPRRHATRHFHADGTSSHPGDHTSLSTVDVVLCARVDRITNEAPPQTVEAPPR